MLFTRVGVLTAAEIDEQCENYIYTWEITLVLDTKTDYVEGLQEIPSNIPYNSRQRVTEGVFFLRLTSATSNSSKNRVSGLMVRLRIPLKNIESPCLIKGSL